MKWLLLTGLLAGCAGVDSETPSTQTEGIPAPTCAKCDSYSGTGHDFVFPDENSTGLAWVKVDHAAMPLLSTAVTARSDAYNDLAPGLVSWNLLRSGSVLLGLRNGLAKVADAWNDDLQEIAKQHPDYDPHNKSGFETCEMDIPSFSGSENDEDLLTLTTGCLVDRIPEVNKFLFQVVWPDKTRIDLSKPASWPNGRILDQQINDLVIAMAFLDMNGNCNGQPCGLHTLTQIPLNPPKNDVPFRDTFPYLAPAH